MYMMSYSIRRPIKMSPMFIWHFLLHHRFKTLGAIFLLTVLFIGFELIYHSVFSNSSSRHLRHRSVVLLDKIALAKLQSRFKVFSTPNPHEQFNKDLLFANLMQGETNQHKNKDLILSPHMKRLSTFLNKLYHSEWKNAPDTDEISLQLKYILIDSGCESKMTCKQIDNLVLGSPVIPMKSKYINYAFEEFFPVERGSYNGNEVYKARSSSGQNPGFVIKSSYRDREAVNKCWKQTHSTDLCPTNMNYRLLREIIFMSTLSHPGILLMEGYCLRGGRVSQLIRKKGQIVVTEVGIPFSESLIASASWSQRVAMTLQVARLLMYLENTPFGSLQFKKLTLSDFVLVRGTIVKLADFDDLELGIWPCIVDFHCHIANVTRGGLCMQGLCEGLNAAVNLHMAAAEIIIPLLKNETNNGNTNLVSRLETMDITTGELLDELKTLFRENPPEGPVQLSQVVVELPDNEAPLVEEYYQRRGVEREKIRAMNVSIIAAYEGENSNCRVMSNFIRHDHENFAGLFDYPCAGSQVSWGCVVTVESVVGAASFCLKDSLCQSFVVFSGNPETESLMTVVLKNGSNATPLVFSATTLYIRQQNASAKELCPEDSATDADNNSEWRNTQLKEKSTEVSPSDVKTCLVRTKKKQRFSHVFREKRLLAHLAVKGKQEHPWKTKALKEEVTGQTKLITAKGKGGQFLVNFAENSSFSTTASLAAKITFMAEDGPDVNHLAYAIVYQLDRLIGLYHTPPCVSRQLSVETVKSFSKAIGWHNAFKSLVTPEGTLSGLMVATSSKAPRRIKFTLEPLSHMTSTVALFTTSSKYQLEYSILSWLSSMEFNQTGYGLQDHLILFDADRAFSSPGVDMSAYLYHCQFPVNVFHSLECFRCGRPGKSQSGAESHVCFFGEEVIHRARAMFPATTKFVIHGLGEEDLATIINMSATTLLRIVDACIATFGSPSVLY